LGLRFFSGVRLRGRYTEGYTNFLPKLGRIFVEYYEDRENPIRLEEGRRNPRGAGWEKVLFEVGF